jgi:transposase-like protein
VITKLTEHWRADQRAFAERDLSEVDYVYLWADAIHVNIRLEEHKLSLLVMIGVRADGRNELIALADGYRESTQSWADLLRDCERRGMRAPVLAVGDGALGFWGALHEVFLETREQRCWFHEIANVLAALPKSAHSGAKKALAEIYNAEDKRRALDAVKAFEAAHGTKFAKAVTKIADDVDHVARMTKYGRVSHSGRPDDPRSLGTSRSGPFLDSGRPAAGRRTTRRHARYRWVGERTGNGQP